MIQRIAKVKAGLLVVALFAFAVGAEEVQTPFTFSYRSFRPEFGAMGHGSSMDYRFGKVLWSATGSPPAPDQREGGQASHIQKMRRSPPRSIMTPLFCYPKTALFEPGGRWRSLKRRHRTRRCSSL